MKIEADMRKGIPFLGNIRYNHKIYIRKGRLVKQVNLCKLT